MIIGASSWSVGPAYTLCVEYTATTSNVGTSATPRLCTRRPHDPLCLFVLPCCGFSFKVGCKYRLNDRGSHAWCRPGMVERLWHVSCVHGCEAGSGGSYKGVS